MRCSYLQVGNGVIITIIIICLAVIYLSILGTVSVIFDNMHTPDINWKVLANVSDCLCVLFYKLLSHVDSSFLK